MWFDCMNGDSRQTGKLTPEGKPDPSVFSTEYNREGIRVGTTIGLMIRNNRSSSSVARPTVRFRQFWGASKRVDLIESLNSRDFHGSYEPAKPQYSNRFSFRPISTAMAYPSWPSIAELSAVEPMLGLNDNRGQALHDFSRETISDRMRSYFDPGVPFEDLTQLHEGLTSNAASFNAKDTRKRLLKESEYHAENVWPFWFKPFDLRWAYIERHSNLWNRVRPELLAHAARGNQFLLVRRHAPKFPDGATIYFSRYISDQHALHTDAYFIPFELEPAQPPKKNPNQSQLALHARPKDSNREPNLAPQVRSYLNKIGMNGADPNNPAAVWFHALSIGHTPRYLDENADGIRQDWPRIPLPDSQKLLLASAELGRQIAALLDTESHVKGITAGDLRPELKIIAITTRAAGGNLKETELALTAGWGHAGKGGITMPGKGKLLERDYSPAERKAILDGARALGLSGKDAIEHFGERTCDVYLNDGAYWSNIPSRVWDYTIGGYQVIKKWLSYREEPLLGRALTKDEVRYVQEMARRIAAILLLEPALDANYEAVKKNAFPWPPKP